MQNVLEMLISKMKELSDKVAVVDHSGRRTTTYGELDRISSQIATEIIKQGYRHGTIIPIRMTRCMEYIAAEIGVLKAGCAFTPLIMEYPQERVDYILNICESDRCIDLEFVQRAIKNEPLAEPISVTENDHAYVIFTSGSTGTPKGIVHTQKSFAAYISAPISAIGFRSSDIYLDTVPHSFILSFFNYVVLCSGGQIHILNDDERKDIHFIEDYIAQYAVTVAVVSPSQQKVFNNKSASLRLMLSAGERLAGQFSTDYQIVNCFGSSETNGNFYFFVDKKYENTPIGKPIDGVYAYILDEDGKAVLDGAEGELCISGAILAEGYIKMPEQTEKAFVPNPFSVSDDDRILFHTNDIVKRLPDGNLVYLNRKDWMVKINGQRVETGEIEVQTANIDGIEASIVKAFDNEYGQTYLVAYYKASKAVSADMLRVALKRQMPDYMIPSFFVQVESFPLNANGKIDRTALMPPNTADFKTVYEAPRNETEQKLCEAFEEILSCGKVGINDDFFALGGDSIKVMRLQNVCGMAGLSTAIIFAEKTPSRIASAVQNTGTDLYAECQHEEHKLYPLTPSQMGIYLACVQNPNGTMYNIPISYTFDKTSNINIERLIVAIKQAVNNHAVLKATIDTTTGTPMMKPRVAVDFEIPIIQTNDLAQSRKDFVKPFDIENDILYRFEILETEKTYTMLMDFHHLVFDGTSVAVICREIGMAYDGAELPSEQLTQFDLSIYEQRFKNTEAYAEAKAYYDSVFAGVETRTELLADFEEDNALENKPSAEFNIFIDQKLSSANVEAFTHKIGVTPNTLFLGAYQYAVAKLTGQNETVVCTVNHGRHDSRLQNTVGMMVRTLPLYMSIDEKSTVADYLSVVQSNLQNTIKHDVYPFVNLASDYNISADVMLAYQSDTFNSFVLGNTTLKMETIPLGSALAKLNIVIFKMDGGFELRFEYRRDLYREETIRSFADMYVKILGEFMTKTALCETELLTEKQKALIDSFNATEAVIEPTTCNKLFEQQVALNPDKTAVIAHDKSLSFKELNTSANKIANALIAKGIGIEARVAYLLNRCADVYCVRQGVLKAGGAFISIDPEYPDDRVSYIMEDSNAFCIITSRELYAERQSCLDGLGTDVLFLDDLYQCENIENPNVPICPENLAYCIYTSGSTGKPKGVMIEHRNLVNMLNYDGNILAQSYVDNTTVFLGLASVAFDVSIIEEMMPIYHGLTVAIATEEEIHNPLLLADMMLRNNVDMMKCTPSYMQLLLNTPEMLEALQNLNAVIIGAERFPKPLYAKMRNAGINGKIFNSYGPTETTVTVTIDELDGKNITIGKPLCNTKLYIVDKENHILPVGVSGELLICGACVGRGYVGNEKLTNEKFINFNGLPAYRSGDLARWNHDGKIEIFGRMDNQVKLHGLRIELDEIENVMNSYAGVTRSVVVVCDNGAEDAFLCGYFTASQTVDIAELTAHLKKSLTYYMVPAVLMQLERIPMNTNGKVDKKALPKPEHKAVEMTPPQNETQQRIFDIIAEIIGNDNFGIETDLFDAGLSSLGIITLVVKLYKTFDTAVKISDISENRTIQMLEQFILQGINAELHDVFSDYPLTKTQEGIFVECIANTGTTIYNIPQLYRFSGSVDVQKLKTALIQTINAHPYLKTVLNFNDKNNIRAYRNDEKPAEVSIIETESLPDYTEIVKPYEIVGGKLYNAEIYVTDNGTYLYFDTHHIVSDGESEAILLADLNKAYEGEILKKEVYTGYELALDEEKARHSNAYEKAKSYYQSIFDGCETDFLPVTDKNEPKKSIGIITHESDVSLESIRAYCQSNNATENAFFNAVFGFVLSRYSYKESSVYTTIYNGRNDPRTANTVTMMVKTLPVFCNAEGSIKTVELVKATQEQLMNSMANDIYAFSEIADAFDIKADVLFVYQGEGYLSKTLCGVSVERISNALDTAKEPILFTTYIQDGKLKFMCEYRSDLYNEDTIQAFVQAFECAVEGFLTKGELKEVSLLNDAVKKQLDSFNNTEVEYDKTKTIVDLFREQVAQTPQNTAVVYLDKHYTYAELDEQTERIAGFIHSMGIGREDAVAVLIPRCEYMAIASIGILKAGAAYQPLDPSYPSERLEFMIQDSSAKLLIADEHLLKLVPNYKGKVLLTKDIPQLPVCDRLTTISKPEDLFILLYTSGSTGLPKGCMLEHRNLVAFCHWYKHYYNLTPESRVAAYASYGFDAHMMDLYPALLTGASVHIIDEQIRLDLPLIAQYFDTNGITHSFMTTQVGRQFAVGVKSQSLRYLSVGGERLVPFIPSKDYIFCNGYGPTECTIFTTTYIVDKSYERVPIGRPLDNLKLYVIDKNGNRLPTGALGELCVAGYQVSRGYLNRPDKTAEVYVSNPFCNDDGYDRMYRTGDVVRMLSDGTVDFIGRNDAQVKIRGFRIELSEVEEVIRRFEGIKDATVVAFDEQGGGKYIVAYIVADSEIDISALNSFIADEKPSYMVPAVTMQIDKIPLNQNQKVNKKALPKPQRKAVDMTPPKNKIQRKIHDIIADVIGSHAFGIDTDIYDAGLTSIGAIKLNVALSNKFDTVVKISDLKENNTVEKLESFLAVHTVRTEAYGVLSDYPLTKTQEGIFVECMANTGTTIYNIPQLYRFGGSVDVQKLKTALIQTINAHPYLKTVMNFNAENEVRAYRHDDIPAEVSIIETASMPDYTEIVKPYEIVGGKLYNAEIYVTDNGNYLYFDAHHIVNDGTSLSILLSDINKAYSGATVEKETYTGFELALDEENTRNSAVYEKAKNYYQSIFDGCETDFLPIKDKNESSPDVAILKQQYTVSAQDIKSYCKSKKVTENAFFNTAFGFMLAKYCGKTEAIYTTIYNGRSDPRTVNAVTMMVKTLPIYCSVDKEIQIVDLVKKTQTQIMDSMLNDIYSFAEISRAFGIKADVMFAYQGSGFVSNTLCGEPIEKLKIELNAAKEPISFNVMLNDDGVTALCEYRSDMYSENTIQAFVQAYECVVKEFLVKTELKKVVMVSDEAKRLLDKFNATDVEVEPTTCNKLFEQQVAINPNKVAVIAGGESFTYNELNIAANKVAHSLIECGIVPDDMVAVMMPRTREAYAAREGIMKAGGAFVPLDPEYPDDRISYILSNARSKVLVTVQSVAEKRKTLFEENGVTVMTMEQMLTHTNTVNPDTGVQPHNLAYCIYTSGSTGKPKGVMIEHHSLVNFVHYDQYNQQAQEYCENMSVSLAFAALTFDVSVLEETLPLYHGATIAMATEDEIHNPLLLAKMLETNKVDVMKCTPSYMLNLLEFEEMRTVLQSMKAIDIGAEAFPAPLYDKMRAAGITAKIYNGYGPTEATITTSIDYLESHKITIGKPLCNTKLYILDKNDNILPVGVPGEMLICGACVGRGYVGNEKLTSEKFITFNGMPAYRSGDFARWNFDGKIEIFGRMDNQIKLHGLRIELDEIENVMNTYPSVTRSVVVVCTNEAGDTFLCGYFTAGKTVDTADLTEHLKKSLTHYMIPAVLMQIEKIPMNTNGKVDKKSLPKPEVTLERAYVAPTTAEEKIFCDAFASVLKIDKVGVTDSFFDLGGTSLMVIMLLVQLKNKGIEVSYSDVFACKTPSVLAQSLKRKHNASEYDKAIADYDYTEIDGLLAQNTLKNFVNGTPNSIGDILVTGATGYLGIHIVYEYLKNYSGRVYCLVRGKNGLSAESRMRSMLYYYFEDSFDTLIGDRLFVIDGDVTGNAWFEQLADKQVDTVINCAALVKHFSDTNDIEEINIGGVRNLIEFCKKQGSRLVQISTVSVSGKRLNGFPELNAFTEQMLYVGQTIDNKYVYSKIMAERTLLESAVKDGLNVKIMRVGNLSPRDKDGEFQINSSTNAFMNRLKAYVMIGAFPYSAMNMMSMMSAIDTTALSVLKLSETPNACRVFHPYTNHSTPIGDIIMKMKSLGFSIDLVEDDVFEERLQVVRNDPEKSKYLTSLLAYGRTDTENKIEALPYINEYTCQILYRKELNWQPNSMGYIGRFISVLNGLGFFDE